MPSWTSAAGGSIPQREGNRRQSTLVSSLSLLDRTLLSTTAPHAGLTLLSLLLPSQTPSSALILSSSSSSFVVILPTASFLHSLIIFLLYFQSCFTACFYCLLCTTSVIERSQQIWFFFCVCVCAYSQSYILHVLRIDKYHIDSLKHLKFKRTGCLM